MEKEWRGGGMEEEEWRNAGGGMEKDEWRNAGGGMEKENGREGMEKEEEEWRRKIKRGGSSRKSSN